MSPRLDWRPFATAVGLTLLTMLLGLRPVDAVLVGAVSLVVGLAWIALRAGEEHPFPEARIEETDGTRLDVAALTWAFLGRDGRVSEAAVRRLRQIAAHRLAAHGVRVSGPFVRAGSAWSADPERAARAREVLGERAWRSLAAPGGIMPSVADIAHCIDVLDALGPPGRPGAAPLAQLATAPAGAPTPASTPTPDERPHP